MAIAFDRCSIGAWSYASKLQVRSDILELLPRDSPGFQAFEKRLARVGGNATIIVVVESPDRAANEKFVDAMREGLENIPEKQLHRHDRERHEGGPRVLPKSNKLALRGPERPRKKPTTKLDHQIAIKSGLVSDLLEDDATEGAGERSPSAWAASRRSSRRRRRRKDEFPTGYFRESPKAPMLAMRIFTTSSGLGGGGDDALDTRVRQVAERSESRELRPADEDRLRW